MHELICVANQLAGFCMRRDFAKRYFRTNINSNSLVMLASKNYLWKWLNIPCEVELPRAAINGY